MAELDFIKELGIGVEPEADTETASNNTEEESELDLSLEPEEKPSDKEVVENTELNDMEKVQEQMEAQNKQMEVMQKRLDDSQDYIKTLKEGVKDEPTTIENVVEEEEVDFWDNPEGNFKELQEELKSLRQEIVQKAEVDNATTVEQAYAKTVDGYYDTVNLAKVEAAAKLDTEFANSMKETSNPYKTAYDYLKGQDTKLRDEIKAELLKEMNVKSTKEVPPNIGGNGSSNSSSKKAPADGFAQLFG